MGTPIETHSDFELSFDLQLLEKANGAYGSIMRLTKTHGNFGGKFDRMPYIGVLPHCGRWNAGQWIPGDCVRLDIAMGRNGWPNYDHNAHCSQDDSNPLTISEVHHVSMRLQGDVFRVTSDGHLVCEITGYTDKKYAAQEDVNIYIGDDDDEMRKDAVPPASAIVSNVKYSPITPFELSRP